ncbi:MAG TPA: class I SAM-dependent methyltransferase [Nocardioides sp.]|uniref:class I SAM-dependent methyltransferase n=1 Tax=Nocardioides sp. TaxID=35761 RepID=UPI002F41B637
MTRDWHAWHEEYADPASSLSRRLEEVRIQLAAVLERGTGPVRLLSLCSGDGRDTIPVVAGAERDVVVTLVELDEELAAAAVVGAASAGIAADVRTGDAGVATTWSDVLPVDVLMLCGVFGNVTDAAVKGTVAAARSMLAPGGSVIWTRGNRVPDDPTGHLDDPAEQVRRVFLAAGFEEVAFVRPADASYRVGVARLAEPSAEPIPDRLFTFVR